MKAISILCLSILMQLAVYKTCAQGCLFEATYGYQTSPSQVINYNQLKWVIIGPSKTCSRGAIMLSDCEGNLQWELGGNWNEAIINARGELVIAGYDSGADDYFSHNKSLLLVLDSLGNAISYYQYHSDTVFGTIPSLQHKGFKDIRLTGDDYLVNVENILVRINYSGDTVWTREFNQQIESLEAFENKFFIGTGDQIHETDTAGHVLRTIYAGRVISSKPTNNGSAIYLTASALFEVDSSFNITKTVDIAGSIIHPIDFTLGQNTILILGKSPLAANYSHVIQLDRNMNWITDYTFQRSQFNGRSIAANDSIFVVAGIESTLNTYRTFAKSFNYVKKKTSSSTLDVGVVGLGIDSIVSQFYMNIPTGLGTSFNLYYVRFKSNAVVFNFGSDSVHSLCVHSQSFGEMNCASFVISKCFSGLMLPPGDSLRLDMGFGGSVIVQDSFSINLCFHTSSVNGRPDADYSNDETCISTHYFVGIDEHSSPFESGIKVYPNPSSGKITIKIDPDSPEEMVYKVYNIQGNTVLRGESDSFNKTISVDLSLYPAGVYFYLITSLSDQRAFTGKFIIE